MLGAAGATPQRAIITRKTRRTGTASWIAAILVATVLLVYVGAAYFLDLLPNIKHGSGSDESNPQQRSSSSSTLGRRGVLAKPSPVDYPERTLRFQVCNGFANQRLAVLYAALMAKKTNRTLVLPTLLSTGTQMGDAQVYVGSNTGLSFDKVYDPQAFITSVARHGVSTVADAAAPPLSTYTHVPLEQAGFDGLGFVKRHQDEPHVAVDCTLFKMLPGDISLREDDQEVMWAVLQGLKPAATYAHVLEGALRSLHARSGAAHQFNVLHLRMERDWLAHCNRWEHLHDGLVRNNCYNNTEDIHTFLKLVNLGQGVPLYVAAYWPDVDPGRESSVLGALRAANYTVVTSRELFAELESGAAALPRELDALLDYTLALAAHKFVGNSVSTFSALALLERRRLGRWASYYNTGNIPATIMLPGLHRLPWVFTYNSWSEPYDHMLKIAVLSAAATSGLKPYCIFLGDSTSGIATWLTDHGVTLIRHEPAWRAQLVAKAREHMKDNAYYSHLYRSADMLVSTFQRLDIAVVPVLDQYTYVLYTDADVYFRHHVSLDDFGLPLPNSVAMAYEFRPDTYPYNAGIMLMNLPQLRRTYDAFMEFILTNTHGLHFGTYGPADQGAFNQFYEADIRPHPLDQNFNAKPYNAFMPNAAIFHFHGPKPAEYLRYVENGTCEGFFWICEHAMLGGLCEYLTEWSGYLGLGPQAWRGGDQIGMGNGLVKMAAEDKQRQAGAADATGAEDTTADEGDVKRKDPVFVAGRLLDACRWLGHKQAPPTWSGSEKATKTLRILHIKRWGPTYPPGSNRTAEGVAGAGEGGEHKAFTSRTQRADGGAVAAGVAGAGGPGTSSN